MLKPTMMPFALQLPAAFVDNESAISMTANEFNELFPFHLILDVECMIVSAGTSMQKVYPVTPGVSFFELFKVVQPKLTTDHFDELIQQQSVVVLRTNGMPEVTFRGQWKKLSASNQLMFIGSPWISDCEDIFSLNLKVSDFAPHDSILDLLMAKKTQEIADKDLKEILEKLNANEAFYRIFQKFPSLVWRARTDKAFDYFNETWTDFTGHTVEQDGGSGWLTLIHPDDIASFEEKYNESFSRREPFVTEFRMKHHSGNYRWIRNHGQPYFDKQGVFAGFVGSCFDETDKKEYEIKLQELNEMKDKLISIIGHDLRNPLINIVSLVELLEKNYHKLDATTVETVIRNLHASSQTTFELLKSLIEWSKSQQKEFRFQPKELDAVKVCHEILGVLKPMADQKHISLHCPNLSGLTFYADENMFKTVMRNLVSNAIKFTRENGNISLNTEKKDHHTVFTLTDDGVGIPNDKLPFLFDPAKSISSNGTHNEVGSGLGLALCKNFVERHRGTIYAESQEGKGTAITFSLPNDYGFTC